MLVADTLPALMLPVTVKLVNVPVEVIFGCAAVDTVAAYPSILVIPVNDCAAVARFNAIPVVPI